MTLTAPTTTDQGSAHGGVVSWPIYSCDDHMDMNSVPVDVWERFLPKGMRERGPRVVEADGRPVWVAGDVRLGVSGKPASDRYSAFPRVGIEDDGFRPSTPKLRLEDMDRDGVFASVIYGPSLMGFPIPDPELKDAVWRAWNDWTAEFNSSAPNRLSVLPILPLSSPEVASSELQRCASLGHRGALIYVHEIDCGDPSWDRLWATAQDTNLPISFHIGVGSRIVPAMNSWRTPAYSSTAPLQIDDSFSMMVWSGALERHPQLTLILAESGIGWLPYFLGRMDGAFEKYKDFAQDYQITTKPSELFARQVYATFEEEAQADKLLPLLPADNLMWASDYPHPDSTWPNSMHAIHENLHTVSIDDRKKMTADTCRRLYKF